MAQSPRTPPDGSQPFQQTGKELRSTEGDTRRAIMLLMLRNGPVTASFLGKQLGLSSAGVRRHLDNLVANGMTEVVAHRPPGAAGGRGRPAKHFRLTDAGRSKFGHSYDDLANDALDALREAGGSAAVKSFAKHRFERIIKDVSGAISEEDDVETSARKLAEALDLHGYAATVTTAGTGVQICQHNCPVAHVAAEHPELCEAELEVFTELLNKHMQPLASIAEGHGVCTTNIPMTIDPRGKNVAAEKMTTGKTKGARRD